MGSAEGQLTMSMGEPARVGQKGALQSRLPRRRFESGQVEVIGRSQDTPKSSCSARTCVFSPHYISF